MEKRFKMSLVAKTKREMLRMCSILYSLKHQSQKLA